MRQVLSGIGMTSLRTRGRMIERLRAKGIHNEQVLAAMAACPRHIFVDEAFASRAYEDTALPLGFSQTISQPYIVARMIELLLEGRSALGKTLEIGTGCGYQAAILGALTHLTYSVERILPLLERARRNLSLLPDIQVHLKYSDGRMGLPEAAPFDSIIVAAAASHVPAGLKEQLAPGGKLILPLGGSTQSLCLVERSPQGFSESCLEEVRFVPLLSGVE